MSVSKYRSINPKREVIVVLKPETTESSTGTAPAVAPAASTEIREFLNREFGATIKRVIPQAAAPFVESPAAAITRHARQKVERFYQVSAPDQRIDEMVASLRAHPEVETVYIKPAGQPPTVPPRRPGAVPPAVPAPAGPPTPDFTGNQIYLNASPVGIGVSYAWALPGGKGTGIHIIDCEWAWNFDHEDLANHLSGNVVGTPQTADDDHGTSVAGILIANDNGFGTIGIAPDAILSTAAFGDSSDQPTSAVITQAADHLSAGDIFLLEIHRPGPNAAAPVNSQQGFIAIEWWPDDFAAIAYATSKGIIVVEPAGNGSANLDDPLYNTPSQGFPADWQNPFAVNGPDSGAIVVGAGNPPPGTHGRSQDTYGFNETFVDRARCSFSNFGSRVDCQGWGWEVSTTGGGDLQPGTANITPALHNFLYTDVFAGTSSASPIVTGTLACLQGTLRAAGRPLLTAKSARRLLRDTGSPQVSAPGRPATKRIGNRPDLKALCSAATSMTTMPMVLNPGTIPDARQQLGIIVELIPIGSSNRPGAPLKPLQITIHNTDNSEPGADARAHAAYQKGADARKRHVSWHFTVDDHNVYQSLPVNEVGWHTGTHRGNYSTIGIEICENAGIDQQAANDRAALLTASQLHELGISLQGNVVQHFNWSGKDCPALLRNPLSGWHDFLAKVAFYYDNILLDSVADPHPELVVPFQAITPVVSAASISTPGIPAQILQIAANSKIARYSWPSRGTAPLGYIKGMALVFARAYCRWKSANPFVAEMAKAETGDQGDALAWYRDEFSALGMDNSVAGPNTLRHLFTLMTGLGMRETSGKYCTGTYNNYTADTAEAGLFQTSYNVRLSCKLLPEFFALYKANPSSDFLKVFQEGASCSSGDAMNYGTGEGRDFQQMEKTIPEFAAEFTAIAMRHIGGQHGNWGPLQRKEAEINSDCDQMFQQVQDAVDSMKLCPVFSA